MIMKLKYLYIWLMGLLAIGCFDDDTTVDTVRISEVDVYKRQESHLGVRRW